MAASSFIKSLRRDLGHRLLLLPAGAAIIKDEDGRILLQQLSDDRTWSLPAGMIEPGETPAEAVKREVLEETGLMSVSDMLWCGF